MRTILVLVVLGISARAATNNLTITDTSGSTQTNRPFSISRVFVQGDYPTGTYPQARVGGSTLLTTQVDVKTNYTDGSIKHAIVSFVVASISANGSVTIDFPQQATCNCGSGQLDKAAMLAYNSGNWGASIIAVNGTGASACQNANGTCTTDAQTLLTAWSGTDGGVNGTGPRYWLKGSVVTQLIIEDISTTRANDFGFDANKPVHPQFILTFYPTSGVTAVRIDYMCEVANTEKLKDVAYALTLQSGSPLATVYTKASFTHAASTRWHKQFWSGIAPTGWTDELHPGVNVNHNLAYWASTGAVPNYDTTVTVTGFAGYLSTWNATDKCDVMGTADYTLDMDSSGGRPDLGIVTIWDARWLFSMNKDAFTVSRGHALCAFGVPMHYRENKTGKTFASTASGIGWPISIEARPTIYMPDFAYGGTDPADAITPIGTTSKNGWNYGLEHVPAFSYVAYIFSGEYYFLEELLFQASMDSGRNVPGAAYDSRGGGNIGTSWGYISDLNTATRAQAWGRRDFGEAAYAAPDASNIKAYFNTLTVNLITIDEGIMNLTASANYCTGSTNDCKWQWGSQTVGGVWGGPTTPNPFHITVSGQDGDDGPYFPTGCAGGLGGAGLNRWFFWTYKYNSLGHLQDLGFPITLANQNNFSTLIHMVKDPAFNPYLIGGYSLCTLASSTGHPFTSFATLLSIYNTNLGGVNLRTVSSWWDTSSDDLSGDGYPHIAQAALSYATGFTADGLSGQDAYDWTTAGCPGSCRISRSPFSDNPQWAVLPRSATPPPSTSPKSAITGKAKVSGKAALR